MLDTLTYYESLSLKMGICSLLRQTWPQLLPSPILITAIANSLSFFTLATLAVQFQRNVSMSLYEPLKCRSSHVTLLFKPSMTPMTLKIKSNLLRMLFKTFCDLSAFYISTLISCLLRYYQIPRLFSVPQTWQNGSYLRAFVLGLNSSSHRIFFSWLYLGLSLKVTSLRRSRTSTYLHSLTFHGDLLQA